RKEVNKSNQLDGNRNCKDNGEDSDDNDYSDDNDNDGDGKKSVKPTRGRRPNVVRNSIEAAFQDIRAIFRKVSDATGLPVSNLRSKFHDLHTTNTTPAAWRMYESYFHDNKEKEQARHRDEGGNAVPDAKGTPLSSSSSQLAHYSLVAKDCWRSFKQLPNYRKRLALHREIKASSTQMTLRERKKKFQSDYHKISKAVDDAYDHNFDVFLVMVGNAVNEDSSLAAIYTTPGLAEFPRRLNTTADECIGFAKTEA
ncbi:hypothetical protein C0991_008669, partial [Blastosporella zonata]